MCRHCRYGLSLLVSARVEVKYTRPPPGLQAALVLMVRTSGEVLEEEEEVLVTIMMAALQQK